MRVAFACPMLWGTNPTSMSFAHLDMDYAFHEDLLPYTCTDEMPLMNPSFMEFMHFDPDAGEFLLLQAY